METKTIECQECLGTGKIEKLICTKPVSECCGGCYTYKECTNCDGEGKIEVDIEDLESLSNLNEIELTESAIKQIGL